LIGPSTTAGSGVSGSLSPPAGFVLKKSGSCGYTGEHPTTDINQLSTSVALPVVWSGVQQVQRRCPWARAMIASPYIQQLRYGLPLPCCGFGHRVGDSTGAVAADLTSGGSGRLQRSAPAGSGIRQKGIGDSGRRRSGGSGGSVCASRARKGDRAG
jgi:hypothetical protein